ncbi:putative reverse transcriptase domain-containing protein [Tanacetum coccineum]
MAKTVKQYISKTRADYGSGVVRPKIEDNDNFKLKGQFLKELRTNTFSGSDHEDANKHIEKVLEIVDLFHILNITIDQVMLRSFPMSLTGVASRSLRNEPTGSITTWDGRKTKILNKYFPPARTAKKIEEINNFQQEPDENLYQAWEGVIPSKTAADAKVAIQEMDEYSQKWHNGTSRSRSTETSDGLAAIQAQLNNLGREIKKNEGKTLKEAYYTQFGRPFQGGGYRAAALRFYQRNNVLQERGFGSLPSSTEANPRDQVKSISTTIKLIHNPKYAELDQPMMPVPTGQNRALMYEDKTNDDSVSKSYESFTLPFFINNVCFDNVLVDLGASVNVMPLSSDLNLGLGELAHTKLTVELADRTVKYPKGIAKNVLVGIGKFVLPIDFIILDIPKDIKVPLILGRPFLSTARAKIDFEKKMELDLEARLTGETLVLNRSLDPFFEDYIELNNLNEPFELRRKVKGDDLMLPLRKKCVI